MGLRVNNNIAAFNSYRNLQATDKTLNSSLEKLSSGLRINKAADDAAGLVISEGLRSQIGGLTVAARNAQDGVNVAQTADGALGTATSILQRMRDLAVQSANDTNDSTSRTAIQKEITSLTAELDRISAKTSFNGVNLLDGSFAGKQFQVGYAAGDAITFDIKSGAATIAAASATTEVWKSGAFASFSGTAGSNVIIDGVTVDVSGATDQATFVAAVNTALSVKYDVASASTTGFTLTAKAAGAATDASVTFSGAFSAATGAVSTQGAAAVTENPAGTFNTRGLGLSTVSLTTQAAANTAITTIDEALKKVSGARADLGALQNRFENVIKSVNVAIENLTASESAIRDTDMASEMTKFTRSQILSQAGTSMLAQANSASQNVLSLLRG
ncbi:flagellin [Kineococcus sp. SYSU DK006]|uniref:flagellin N-terminal helical domain-containing protein n=1 Tax=Kineococcus sp. SYSU DK006 TaxID=3383127 RepID=UPI003D7CC495